MSSSVVGDASAMGWGSNWSNLTKKTKLLGHIHGPVSCKRGKLPDSGQVQFSRKVLSWKLETVFEEGLALLNYSGLQCLGVPLQALVYSVVCLKLSTLEHILALMEDASSATPSSFPPFPTTDLIRIFDITAAPVPFQIPQTLLFFSLFFPLSLLQPPTSGVSQEWTRWLLNSPWCMMQQERYWSLLIRKAFSSPRQSVSLLPWQIGVSQGTDDIIYPSRLAAIPSHLRHYASQRKQHARKTHIGVQCSWREGGERRGEEMPLISGRDGNSAESKVAIEQVGENILLVWLSERTKAEKDEIFPGCTRDNVLNLLDFG